MDQSLDKTHFELFGLAAGFAIDLGALEQSYRALQSRFHPDRFAAASVGDRRRSVEISTRINQAYTTLRAPLSRARYVLELAGVELREEGAPGVSQHFLAEQMSWWEAIESEQRSHGIEGLTRLQQQLAATIAAHQRDLGALLDERRDYDDAGGCLRRIFFLDRLRQDLERRIDRADG